MTSRNLVEIPFVLLDENKQPICPFDVNTELAQSQKFRTHFWNLFKYKIYPPDDIKTVKSLKEELKNTVLKEMKFPEYYITTDYLWFISAERRGFVKYVKDKHHDGIQRIHRIERSLSYQMNNPCELWTHYTIDILHDGQPYKIEIAIKDALSFKKIQQACLKRAGIVYSSIKNKEWELLFDFYLRHTTPKVVGKPLDIPKNNFVELDTSKADEIKALQGKVAELTDRLGDDVKKTLTKRYKDDKKIMDGILK